MQNATSAFLQGVSAPEAAPPAESAGPAVDEAAVMAAIRRDDVNEVDAVAATTGADPATVAQTVERLSDEGFVDRTAGLKLTEAGERFVRYHDLSR